LLRLVVLPFAVLLRVASSAAEAVCFSRKGLAEAWARLGRTTRGTLAWFSSPARGVMWVMRRVAALFRAPTPRRVLGPDHARRALRLFRHVRYHVAVRLRGDEQA
jgi:hypothetical protein